MSATPPEVASLQVRTGNLTVGFPADEHSEAEIRAYMTAIERAYPGLFEVLPAGTRIEITAEATSIRPDWALASVHYPAGSVQASLTGADDSRYREAATVEALLLDVVAQFGELFYYEGLPHEDVLWSYPVFKLTDDGVVTPTTSGGRLVVTETSFHYCPAIGRSDGDEPGECPREAVVDVRQEIRYISEDEEEVPQRKGWRARLKSWFVPPSSHPFLQVRLSNGESVAYVSAFGESDTRRLYEELYSVLVHDIVPSVRLPRSRTFVETLTLSGMDRALRARTIDELDEWTADSSTVDASATPPSVFGGEPFERTSWDGVPIYYDPGHFADEPGTRIDPDERELALRTKSGGRLPPDAYVYLVSVGAGVYQATLAVGHRSIATVCGLSVPRTLRFLSEVLAGETPEALPKSAQHVRRTTSDVLDSINRPWIKVAMFKNELESTTASDSFDAEDGELAFDVGGDGLTEVADVAALVEAAGGFLGGASGDGGDGDGGDVGFDLGGGV